MPQPHEQNRSFEVTTLEQTDASITVQVSRSPSETVVFTYTPPYKFEVDFPGNQAPGDPGHRTRQRQRNRLSIRQSPLRAILPALPATTGKSIPTSCASCTTLMRTCEPLPISMTWLRGARKQTNFSSSLSLTRGCNCISPDRISQRRSRNTREQPE